MHICRASSVCTTTIPNSVARIDLLLHHSILVTFDRGAGCLINILTRLGRALSNDKLIGIVTAPKYSTLALSISSVIAHGIFLKHPVLNNLRLLRHFSLVHESFLLLR